MYSAKHKISLFNQFIIITQSRSKLGCYYLSGEISNYLKPSWLSKKSPPWFCYIQLQFTRLLKDFRRLVLDDGALGGSAENVLKDLETIIVEFEKLGLSLNYSKCELFHSLMFLKNAKSTF
jgi:hypothetical protein